MDGVTYQVSAVVLIQHNPNEGLKLSRFCARRGGRRRVLIQHTPNEGLKRVTCCSLSLPV